ncbi:MAG: hypothetical protein J3R72DRAFT_450413 [Linnemannia gamsii]|nr:MAG: hypothetical protein J3R72DRAFT_450413 [Linnemannia gamsii]
MGNHLLRLPLLKLFTSRLIQTLPLARISSSGMIFLLLSRLKLSMSGLVPLSFLFSKGQISKTWTRSASQPFLASLWTLSSENNRESRSCHWNPSGRRYLARNKNAAPPFRPLLPQQRRHKRRHSNKYQLVILLRLLWRTARKLTSRQRLQRRCHRHIENLTTKLYRQQQPRADL